MFKKKILSFELNKNNKSFLQFMILLCICIYI